jgi:hypothetical protein
MTVLCQECASYLFLLGNPPAYLQLEQGSAVAAAVCFLTKATVSEAQQTRREEADKSRGQVEMKPIPA